MIDPILLTTTRILTFCGRQALTNASGFFFEREGRLFLVSSRHVMIDTPGAHFPDRLEIGLHTDAANLASAVDFSIPLYRQGERLWRQTSDGTGDIDVAVIEIHRPALPASLCYHAFTLDDVCRPPARVDIGSALLVVGFPLGFHDTLHHMPVVRHAVLASAFGLRFQGEGFFLTDARTHRGTSGAPVVQRIGPHETAPGELGYRLLGIHSAQLDMRTRDRDQDDSLGLNCTWYADVLETLTTQA